VTDVKSSGDRLLEPPEETLRFQFLWRFSSRALARTASMVARHLKVGRCKLH
jgi:hypothetical protein